MTSTVGRLRCESWQKLTVVLAVRFMARSSVGRPARHGPAFRNEIALKDPMPRNGGICLW